MHKDFVFLKKSIEKVCQSLKTEPLTSLDCISRFSAEFDVISARLRLGIIPRPAKINALSAGLWLTRMRVANLSGGQSAAISELDRLVDLLGRVCSILKKKLDLPGMDVVTGIDDSIGSGDSSGVSGVMAGIMGRGAGSVVLSHCGVFSRCDNRS